MKILQSRGLLVLGILVLVLLAAALVATRGRLQSADPRQALADVSPTATQTPTGDEAPLMPTPAAPAGTAAAPSEGNSDSEPSGGFRPLNLPEVTPPPGGQVYLLRPGASAVGWAADGDDKPNQFGDYNIYAGTFEGQKRIGAMQFDLSDLPAGADIAYADLSLTGLTDQWLGQSGTWTVDLLGPWMDGDWSSKAYRDLSWDYAPDMTLGTLAAADLGRGRTNTLVLDRAALDALETRVFGGKASLRIDGPAGGEDNLFGWDSGYGTDSLLQGPVLRIVAGPAPQAPPPSPTPVYTVVTFTPQPGNIVTVAAMRAANPAAVAAAVAASETVSVTTTPTPSATPLPPRWATPVVVEPTETPGNAATAQWQIIVATAEAVVNGTPTPLPANAWTATPTATFVVVTNTPEPASPAQRVAQAAAEATRWAGEGTPTPFPPGWVTATPLVELVTATPTPLNRRTAEAQLAQATVSALLVGTATPTPANWVTPTPLPLLVPMGSLDPTPTLTPTPGQIPAALRGRIIFRSNRLDPEAAPEFFVMDPDGGNVTWLTQSYPYNLAYAGETLAPDGRRKVIVQPDFDNVLQLYIQSASDNSLEAITDFDRRSYDPAWSPVNDRIAFVSTMDRNDEIYTVGSDGSDLQRLTFNDWEWDKHPSWSPDGSQIVFYSNRDTGRRQIWAMNADGSNVRNLSNNDYEDWDPVWVK